MEREAALLAQKLGHLTKRYQKTNCLQCDLLQKHIKKEYQEVKSKLIVLERLIQSNNRQDISISNLKKSNGILGLYVMV